MEGMRFSSLQAGVAVIWLTEISLTGEHYRLNKQLRQTLINDAVNKNLSPPLKVSLIHS